MFIAYDNALDLIRSLRPVLAQLQRYDADAAKQLVRAGNSILNNLGEGRRRHGKDCRRFYRMAHGSAGEIQAILDSADAWGWTVETQKARALLDRELALLWGLCR